MCHCFRIQPAILFILHWEPPPSFGIHLRNLMTAHAHTPKLAPMDDELQFYTVPEVAEMFRLTDETVWKRARTMQWPAHRDGRRIIFSYQDIQAIRASMVPVPPPSNDEIRRAMRGKARRKSLA